MFDELFAAMIIVVVTFIRNGDVFAKEKQRNVLCT